jgi:hypothetical protein
LLSHQTTSFQQTTNVVKQYQKFTHKNQQTQERLKTDIPPSPAGWALPQLLLVPHLSQPLLALVRGHLVPLALFTAGHDASFPVIC